MHLVGVVVVTSQDGRIITCYKSNTKTLRRIRKLKKYTYSRYFQLQGANKPILAI